MVMKQINILHQKSIYVKSIGRNQALKHQRGMIDTDYVWMIENEVTAHKRCQLYIYILIIYSDLWRVRILFGKSQHYTHLTLTTSLYVVRVSVFEMTPVRNAFFGIVIGRDRLTFHFFHPLWPNFSWPVAMLILPLPAMLISDLFESQTFCLVFDWQVLEQMMLFFGEAPRWHNMLFVSEWRSNSCSLLFSEAFFSFV